jgi:hypothetical protein
MIDKRGEMRIIAAFFFYNYLIIDKRGEMRLVAKELNHHKLVASLAGQREQELGIYNVQNSRLVVNIKKKLGF